MEVINRCLEIDEVKRAALSDFDGIAETEIWRELGNRKERRRQEALSRKSKETA